MLTPAKLAIDSASLECLIVNREIFMPNLSDWQRVFVVVPYCNLIKNIIEKLNNNNNNG